uniref:Uncharacterized protein n=1 Tax=Globisporangium ultimum (strain ATCC 200006 / CBS 805.95 / DAOM BR144) TaxID=431595 RepID=K3WTG6_GLOUD
MDVDMEASAADPQAASARSLAFLNTIATGTFQELPVSVDAARMDERYGDAAQLMLAPFLPLLTRLDHAQATHAGSTNVRHNSRGISRALVKFEQVNMLREYAHVFQHLQVSDVEKFAHQQLREQQQQKMPQMPMYRRFENAKAHERTCVVLAEVYTQSFQSQPTRGVRESELFANGIYKDDLVAIFVNALASPSLQTVEASPFHLSSIVRFCLNIPLGVAILERLVLNDPSIVDHVIDGVIESLVHVQPQNAQEATRSTLPVEFVQAEKTCVALASLAPTYAVFTRSKLSESKSLWALAIALHLTATIPALHDDMPAYLFQLMKQEASSTPEASASGTFSAYLRLGVADNATEGKQEGQHPLQQSAIETQSVLRQHLLESLDGHTSSPFTIVSILNVFIGFLVMANFRPSDHEITQLLRWCDRASKDSQNSSTLTSRVVSLAYVLVVFLCYPLAPALNKIPSQRDEVTKSILSLSQQCIFSLYNTKKACPLFIITAVLLYTKSPSLLPFLASVVGNDGLAVQTLRAEYFHVFGDVVLKPILTESIMAREVLTFAPVAGFDALDDDILHEMTLRSIYGLLCEKSFLRHHHGRKLEEWITLQIDEAVAPIHPLIINVLLEWIENYIVAFEYPIAQKPLIQLSIIPLRSTTVTKWLNARCLAQPYKPRASRSKTASEPSRSWAKAVLALVYALQFNQRVRHAMMVSGSKISELSTEAYPANGDVCLAYELTEFPLRNILHQVLSHGGKGECFEYVAPMLLRLMLEEYPHRVGTSSAALSTGFDRDDLERCWFRKRQRLHLESVATMDATSMMTSESWMARHLFVADLETAPSRVLVEEFETLVDRMLPVIIRTRKVLRQHVSDDARMYGEAFCAQLASLYERRVQYEHCQRSALKMKLVHAICFPDLVWKHYQQHQHQQGVGQPQVSSHTVALNHLVTYGQIVEEPFRLLSDAHDVVYESPALLRVVLVLLKGFRDAANTHLKNQDPALIPRKQVLQGSQASTGADPPASTSSSHAAKTSSVQHHLLVQDCLIVHALLKKMTLQSASDAAADPEATDIRCECNRLLCDTISELFQDEDQSSPLPPHRVILAVHNQGYDASLIPVLLENVSSMILLWEHWTRPTTMVTPATASTSSGSRSSQSSSGKTILNEFLIDVASEKDYLAKWKFRLQLYFSLCGKYFDASQTTVVLQIMKQVWNKLRSVLMTVVNSATASSSSATHNDELRLHAAFLDEVLPLAVTACAQHPELSAEMVQFLLKLQKQGGSNTNANAVISTWRHDEGTNASRTPAKDLDDVLRDAYARLLAQI